MIKVEINGEKKEIPIMEQLTVKQYIKFVQTDMSLVNYLSVCFNVKYKEAFNTKLKNADNLKYRIGELKDYTKVSAPKKLIINDELYFIKNIDVSTVGQRFMIEENAKKLKNEELYCFILAVGIVKDPMSIVEINRMKRKLMNEPYIKILPLGFFLAKRFLIGRRSVMSYLRESRVLINMKAKERRQELKN